MIGRVKRIMAKKEEVDAHAYTEGRKKNKGGRIKEKEKLVCIQFFESTQSN